MPPRIDPARVRELLSIGEESGRLRVYPFALALLNMAVCAGFERLITSYAQGHYLYFFYLVELSGLVLLGVGMFVARDRKIIINTSILPLSAADRFCAVALRVARSRSILALVLSTCLFTAVVFGSRTGVAVAAGFFYLVAAALTIAATAFVCLFSIRSSRAALVLIVTCVAAAGGILLVSMMLDATALASVAPISSWVTRAVLAVESGAVASAFLWGGSLCAALLAVIGAGVRGT